MTRFPVVVAALLALAPAAAAQPSPGEPAAPKGVGASFLDHALVGVRPVDKDLVELLIEDRGRAKAPTPIAIIRVGNDTTRCEVPVSAFLGGARMTSFRVPARPAIVRIVLDPDHAFPDANRANNVWTARR